MTAVAGRRPRLLDLFCCGGGAGEGYRRAGFDVYGIDNDPKTLKVNPMPWLVADAMLSLSTLLEGHTIGPFSDGRVLSLRNIVAIHGSPPCQGYSIMNNLPWIRSRTYPLLILPLRELLEQTGKPYIIENVAGAASKKNLEKLELLEHRLRAGWLCGGMFGLPIYRHRYFETNWFWLQPGHPKHLRTRQAESSFSPRPRGVWEAGYEAEHPGESPQGVDARKRPHLIERLPGSNGAATAGAGFGHTAGWHLAAEAMGISWMNRATLTQAIPPVMTEYLGNQLRAVLL